MSESAHSTNPQRREQHRNKREESRAEYSSAQGQGLLWAFINHSSFPVDTHAYTCPTNTSAHKQTPLLHLRSLLSLSFKIPDFIVMDFMPAFVDLW